MSTYTLRAPGAQLTIPLLVCAVFTLSQPGSSLAQVQVSSYSELRSLSCNSGELAEIRSGRFSGSFMCVSQSALPRGRFDDGGLQFDITADSDFWLRQDFNTASNPIELDWFEWIADQARLDTLVQNLIRDFSDLYLRAPSSLANVNTLNWQDGFVAGSGLRNFHFLESDRKTNIVHTGSREPVAMIVIENYREVKIGGPNLNLEFYGKHPGADCAYPLQPGVQCSDASSTLDAKGLWQFHQSSSNGVLLDWSADCRDADDYCIHSDGGGRNGSNRTASIRVKGTFINGSVGINGGVVDVDVDVTIEDPHGASMGWDGTAYPDNADCAAGNRGTNEKNKALIRVHDADNWTGKIVLRYGWAKWFSVDTGVTGTSLADPLVIEYDSLGWLGPISKMPGERIDTESSCVYEGGKMDPWFDEGTTRWMRISEQPGSNFALTDPIRIVATSSSRSWTTCCIDVEFNGMQKRLSTRVEQDTDEVRDMTIRGGPTPNYGDLLQIGDNYTVTGGEWCDIFVEDSSIREQPPTTNTIKDLKVSPDCSITFRDAAPTGITTIGGVTFLGAARSVINMNVSGDYTVEVPAGKKLTAPIGSKIENRGGGATLVCSGRTQNLPYTFDGITDDCEGESSPETSPPPEITVVSPNGGESWVAGTNHNVTWNDNVDENVRIELVRGGSAETIVSSTQSDGSYSWAIPAGQTAADYSIRITSVVDPAVTDESDAVFAITPPPPTSQSQQIDLDQGWNLVSSYVEPSDPSVEVVLSSIIDDVVLVKDQDGNIFSPDFGINTIGSWRPLEAYQFNVRRNVSLLMVGATTSEDTPISLRQGWNMVAVLLAQPVPVEECLFSIQDELIVAKDNFGRVYNPTFEINTIGDFVPGQGYTVYVEPTATLNYSVRGKR